MANVTVSNMKGSEYHRIVAAVLEVMEKALTEPQKDVSIQESGEPDRWKMTFQKASTTLDEMNGVKNELGTNFEVTMTPRDKSSITISIMAPSSDFIALLQRKPAGMPFQRNVFGNGTRQEGGENKTDE